MSGWSSPEAQRLGILARREIEAGVLAPFVRALRERLGDDAVLPLLAEVIRDLAREHGRRLAAEAGDDSLRAFAGAWEPWTRGGALEIEWLAAGDERELAFNVRRCRYAEMYRALGIPELGRYLSCNRDAALVEGFNPAIRLTRTQTILEGAPFCDFRYRAEPAPAGAQERPEGTERDPSPASGGSEPSRGEGG